MRVSVVVPVYNPGESLHRCVDSLLSQSLPTDALELIFVDDGSTDGSGEWLDEVASRHQHVQVIHEPNSGWAGRPRNVGLDAATGEFVQFVDQDDALGTEALARLTAFGAEHGADIVIGKVTSDFRRVPQELFRTNVPRCSIRDTALIRSLTPHKMFRRRFLIDNALRYGEGKRRLEDQLFMTQAYLATDAVAILSDYPCYYYLRRDDGGNNAKRNYEPAYYYQYVREVLDVVEENTTPGEFRDSLHERFLNAMLHKVQAATRPGETERLPALMAEIADVAGRYFRPEVAHRLPFVRRQLAVAMLTGTPEQTRQAAQRYRKVTGELESATVSRSGEAGWTVSVRASLVFRDGSPIRFRPDGDRWRVDKRLTVDDVEAGPDRAEDLIAAASADLVLRSPSSGVVWLGPTSLAAHLEPVGGKVAGAQRLVIEGSVRLDPARFAAGAALPPGTWNVNLRLSGLGTSRSIALKDADVKLSGWRLRRSGHARIGLNGDRLAVFVSSR